MKAAEEKFVNLEAAKAEYDAAAELTTELANESQETAKEAEKTRVIEEEEQVASDEKDLVEEQLDPEVVTEVETAQQEREVEIE